MYIYITLKIYGQMTFIYKKNNSTALELGMDNFKTLLPALPSARSIFWSV